MISDKDSRDVEAYLCNRLPISRKLNFEKKLFEQPELKEYLEKSRNTILGLNTIKKENKIKNVIELARKRKKVFWIKPVSLAASVILVLLQAFSYSNYLKSQDEYYNEIFEEVYEPFQNNASRSEEEDSCPESSVIDLIEQGQLNGLLEKLTKNTPCYNYYKGIVFLALKNYEKASGQFELAETTKDENLKYEAQWQNVIALLKANPSRAEQIIEVKILSNPLHPYKNVALKINQKLKSRRFSIFKIIFK